VSISATVEADGRQGRIFARDPKILQTALEREGVLALEDDDNAREPRLRAILATGRVKAAINPGVDPDDVQHVFLEEPGTRAPVFACVIVSRQRLERMLDQAPLVVESFGLQVALGNHLTPDELRAALEAWTERNFAGMAPPKFRLDQWVDPDGIESPRVPPRIDDPGSLIGEPTGDAHPSSDIAWPDEAA
jgi:hypothetical protein